MFEISVIIPCYNAVKYIDACISSLIKQTVEINRIQVILVDDASADGTDKVLKSFEEQYPDNVILIQNNMQSGAGNSRNIGLSYATAPFVVFADADDFFEKEYLEKLLCMAKKSNADMVRCRYDYYADGEFVQNKGDNNGYLWNAIYKKSVIVENNIFFPDTACSEDRFFLSLLSCYIGDCPEIPDVLYHYRISGSSLMTTRNSEALLSRLDAEELLVREYRKRNLWDSDVSRFTTEFIKRFFLNTLHVVFTRFDYIPDIFDRMRATIHELVPNYLNDLDESMLNASERAMISLIEMPLDIGMLQKVKEAYL